MTPRLDTPVRPHRRLNRSSALSLRLRRVGRDATKSQGCAAAFTSPRTERGVLAMPETAPRRSGTDDLAQYGSASNGTQGRRDPNS